MRTANPNKECAMHVVGGYTKEEKAKNASRRAALAAWWKAFKESDLCPSVVILGSGLIVMIFLIALSLWASGLPQ